MVLQNKFFKFWLYFIVILCAISCQNGVLNIEDKKQIEAKIEIDVLTCLSWQNTMCFSCKDPCLENAIDF